MVDLAGCQNPIKPQLTLHHPIRPSRQADQSEVRALQKVTMQMCG